MDDLEDQTQEHEAVEWSGSLAVWREGKQVDQGSPDQTGCNSLSGRDGDGKVVPDVERAPGRQIIGSIGIGRDLEGGIVEGTADARSREKGGHGFVRHCEGRHDC